MLTFLLMRSSSKKKEAEMMKARAEYLTRVMEQDKEIESDFDQRTKELAEQIEKDGTSSELSDPNNW
jgi:hypothetical protein